MGRDGVGIAGSDMMDFGRGWKAQRERKLGKGVISADGEIKSERESNHLWNVRHGRLSSRPLLRFKIEK